MEVDPDVSFVSYLPRMRLVKGPFKLVIQGFAVDEMRGALS